MKQHIFILILSCTTFIYSCNNSSEKTSSGKLRIVTTTGIIEDVVKNIVGDSAEVISLMGAGVDPHLYKASQGDIEKLSNADIIIYNGLHLEGKMTEVLEKLGKNKKVIAMSDGLSEADLIQIAGTSNVHDPHIWFDVQLWKKSMLYIAKTIASNDSTHKTFYLNNSAHYATLLDSTHQRTLNTIAQIPNKQRILITAHDAFGYFGKAYHIEVKGLQGISTLSDFGLNDLSSLVNLIVSRNIKAVFVESSVPKKSIEALVEGCKGKGHEVTIGGTLFSDAMGNKGTPEGTYIGMVNYNANTISKALK